MLQARCSICKMIKKETLTDGSSKLERRLYNCSKFVKGGESQAKIVREYGFNAIAMSRHLNIHQNPDAAVAVANKFQETLEKKGSSHQEVREAMKEKGMADLKSGDMKIKAADLRGVAKDEAEIEERNKDRSLKMAEMIFAFSSGEQGGQLGNNPDRIAEGDTTE